MQKISRKKFEWFKQKHYELWDWLSKNPDKGKEDWFNSIYYVGTPKKTIKDRCFACEFAWKIGNIEGERCKYCPLCKREFLCLNGLYDEYRIAKSNYNLVPENKTISRTRVIELAKQIRDLPWSEEYVEDEEMNNENYIVINGKKAELTEEQLKQLGIEVGKDKRERVKAGDIFFFVDRSNCIDSCVDSRAARSNYCYDTHNYFKTREEAKEYAEVLGIKRQLMKFADEHNDKIDWEDIDQFGYIIYWNPCLNDIRICKDGFKTAPEIIYFSSVDIAQQAIDEIGKENIIKYLTYNY